MAALETFRDRVMGGPCEIQVGSGPQATEQVALAMAEIQRIETKYSRYKSTSVVSEINQAAGKKKSSATGKPMSS